MKTNKIIIEPCPQKPRENWERSFKNMKKRKDDTLIIDDKIDLEMKDWDW